MLDAIREAGVRRIAAEVEVGLAWVTHRPFADAVVEIEQARLVGNFRARLRRHQAAWWGRRNRRLLIAGTLANEAARADGAILHIVGLRALRRTRSGSGRSGAFRRGGRRGRSGLRRGCALDGS